MLFEVRTNAFIIKNVPIKIIGINLNKSVDSVKFLEVEMFIILLTHCLKFIINCFVQQRIHIQRELF